MFDLEKAIAAWRRQMEPALIRARELDELESHLRDDVQAQMEAGTGAREAFTAAVKRLGPGTALHEEFAKVGCRRVPRPRFMRAYCYGTSLFLLTVNAYYLLNFDPNPLEEIAGWAMTLVIASFLLALPDVQKLLPRGSQEVAAKVAGIISLGGVVWVAWSLLTCLQPGQAQPGQAQPGIFNITMWALCAAGFVAAVVLQAYGLGARAGGVQNSGRVSQEGFSPLARQVQHFAQEEAARFHHDFIGTEHLLLGLLRLEQGAVPRVVRRLGLVPEMVRIEIDKIIGAGLASQATRTLPFTPRARRAFGLAVAEAEAMNASETEAEHILLGLVLEGDGVAARVLNNLEIHPDRVRKEILREMGSDGDSGPQPVPA